MCRVWVKSRILCLLDQQAPVTFCKISGACLSLCPIILGRCGYKLCLSNRYACPLSCPLSVNTTCNQWIWTQHNSLLQIQCITWRAHLWNPVDRPLTVGTVCPPWIVNHWCRACHSCYFLLAAKKHTISYAYHHYFLVCLTHIIACCCKERAASEAQLFAWKKRFPHFVAGRTGTFFEELLNQPTMLWLTIDEPTKYHW